MNNVLILCHRRGWNKLTNFILGLKKLDYRVTVVSDEYLTGDFNQFGLDKADEVCINENFNVEEILLHTPTADIIYSISENLLPVQSQLEKHYGLNNVSEYAAEILSHKDKFDTYCRDIGLGKYVPDSIVPITPSDLNMFNDRAFVIKPTIGNGTKRYGTYSNLEYYGFNNKADFLKYLKLNNLDSFFDDNVEGFIKPNFNNVKYRLIAQEFLDGTKGSHAPYTYIDHDSEVNLLWWFKMEMIKSKDHTERFEEQVYKVSSIEGDIEEELTNNILYFLTTLAKELQLKNIFTSGPEFFSNLKMFDINPRPGNGMNICDAVNDNKIWPQILSEAKADIQNHYVWQQVQLKPGKVKEVGDTSYLTQYADGQRTRPKIEPGSTIPEFSFIVDPDFCFPIITSGKNRVELGETVIRQLQDSISYY